MRQPTENVALYGQLANAFRDSRRGVYATATTHTFYGQNNPRLGVYQAYVGLSNQYKCNTPSGGAKAK